MLRSEDRGASRDPWRRPMFALCLFFSIFLNLAVLGLLVGAPVDDQVGSLAARVSSDADSIVFMRVSPTPALSEHGEAAPAAEPFSLPKHSDVARRAGTNADAPTRFYRIDEVDTPASPDSDWNLDSMTLYALGLDRVVFDVYISRSGDVLRCDFHQPSQLDPLARQVLEERILSSTLQPALRGGKAVASVRRIEIAMTPGQ